VLQDNIQAVLSGDEIIALQRLVREVPVSDNVIRYTLSLVRQTRVGQPGVPEYVADRLNWGAGPRAVQFLILGGKARALLHGRTHVSTEDIQALARPVLRHRIVVNFAAESEGIRADDVIDHLVNNTPTKEDELTRDPRFQAIFAS
jgi:MoxR-like ATPase